MKEGPSLPVAIDPEMKKRVGESQKWIPNMPWIPLIMALPIRVNISMKPMRNMN
jgi:hypothetical protein